MLMRTTANLATVVVRPNPIYSRNQEASYTSAPRSPGPPSYTEEGVSKFVMSTLVRQNDRSEEKDERKKAVAMKKMEALGNVLRETVTDSVVCQTRIPEKNIPEFIAFLIASYDIPPKYQNQVKTLLWAFDNDTAVGTNSFIQGTGDAFYLKVKLRTVESTCAGSTLVEITYGIHKTKLALTKGTPDDEAGCCSCFGTRLRRRISVPQRDALKDILDIEAERAIGRQFRELAESSGAVR